MTRSNNTIIPSKFDSLLHFLLQKKKVPAQRVASKATEWVKNTDSPRFLWVHFMEPHSPYFAGLSKAWSNGLYKTYSTTWRHITNSQEDNINSNDYEEFVDKLEEIHRLTLDDLDRSLVQLLDHLPSDENIIIVGDHGEEFSEEWYGHSRPYDECVKVPFITNIDSWNDTKLNRQIELPYTFLKELGIEIPLSWEKAIEYNKDLSFIIHPSIHNYGQFFVGCRTEKYKYLQIRDPKTVELTDEKLYDLIEDPQENTDISTNMVDLTEDFNEQIDNFLSEFGIDISKYSKNTRSNINEDVNQRLKELGYIE